MVASAKKFIKDIYTTISKDSKDDAIVFLTTLRNEIDKMIGGKKAWGGGLGDISQTYNIQQGQFGGSSVNPTQFKDGGAVAESRKIVHSISKEDLKDAISDAHGEGELSETLTIDNLDKWSDDDFHIVSEYVIENRYDAPVYETFDERDDVSDAFSNYPDKPRPQYAKGGSTQGYADRQDESLGMRTGKESTKKQSMRARREDSYGKMG